MNDEILKAMLVRDRGFLYSLYQGSNVIKNKRILANANDSEINTLLRYLHFVSSGKIPMTKKNFDQIPAFKLKLIKKNVETAAKLEKILK